MSTHNTGGAEFNVGLPPDIVESTLPFLSAADIRNLSLTNKYYHQLLNYEGGSLTLWHELFRKAYGTLNTNEEPFKNSDVLDYMTCSESIMTRKFPDETWKKLFQRRTEDVCLYTWGCLKHARLGYTSGSNELLKEEDMNGTGSRFKYGVNKPTRVPWFPTGAPQNDRSVVQVSAGGYSFQILTRSGKIFSTGSTYTGGHKGPGPANGQVDFNPFRDAIRRLETSYPRFAVGSMPQTAYHPINTTGTFHPTTARPPTHFGPTPTTVPTSQPHSNIYSELEEMEQRANEQVAGNKHLVRMFTRNSFPIYGSPEGGFRLDEEKFGAIKFVAIASGRSHFIALTNNNILYSWDSTESNHGVEIKFEDLPSSTTNPILKIACGWDFSCVYIYNVGLVIWKERDAVLQGETAAKAHYFIVPNTADLSGDQKLVDFSCGQDNTIYFIDSAGTELWRYSKNVVTSHDVPGVRGKLLKCISCLSSLVLFTSFGCYSIKLDQGELDSSTLVQLQLDDPEDHIISLASGDYHTLALTKKGQLYTWGVESQISGCLGIGRPEHVVDELGIGRWDGVRNVRVEKPTHIALNDAYTAVSVAAGGWQSGALILPK
ncbi:SCF ubiquitin ligase complex subunit SAF1 KNAG_0C01690 [Huiozyma naganishii CBS 8797]|uniref:F-box domain-containing protein n=1 Tax=Huiozyma naganishii (strain ATCC MYA-139 / BCRC 22969 / CBS 8797 / KCTC 17520 / NBRC 10181 / NCYC 3082 / Yp74L-3) TaxID=1071383 RepID=J7RIC3_HUIN7|nr:hypothetical protein KNAG_0C01690 [Kazachstania naganishii CBS 8797]CCK69283.1 hypothetical protein KNAG_0C01690 [Kazachstania naganishii CBS 8797]